MEPYQLARAQMGVLWRHQGRKHGKYLDCIGLVVHAFRDYGIQDRDNYPQDPSHGVLERSLEEQFGAPIMRAPIRVEDLRPNDVAAFAFPSVIRHVGIIAPYEFNGGGLTIIHTNSSVGWVTEQRLDRPWPRLIKRVYRLPDLLTREN